MRIKILLADDHRILRDGLRSLLEKEPDMEVVAEAEDGRMAVELAQELSPDVALVDISMPELNGIEATDQILSANPDAKIIALSMHSDKHFLMGMLRAGASGYVLKNCAATELCSAIRTVVSGETYLSPEVAQVVIQDHRLEVLGVKSGQVSRLTAKEREVLKLVAEGKTSREIASQCDVSVKTVQAHRQNIMDKLGIRTVAGLTKYAIQKGITVL